MFQPFGDYCIVYSCTFLGLPHIRPRNRTPNNLPYDNPKALSRSPKPHLRDTPKFYILICIHIHIYIYSPKPLYGPKIGPPPQKKSVSEVGPALGSARSTGFWPCRTMARALTCAYTYIYMYICVYMYVSIYVYIYICIHMCIYMCMYMCVYIYICMYLWL